MNPARRALPWLLVALLIATSAAQASVPARANGKTTIAPTGLNVEDANVDYLRASTLWAPTITSNTTGAFAQVTSTQLTSSTIHASNIWSGSTSVNNTLTATDANWGTIAVGNSSGSYLQSLATANESGLKIYTQKSDGRAELDLWVRQPPGYSSDVRAASW